jgi:hypothetical protein
MVVALAFVLVPAMHGSVAASMSAAMSAMAATDGAGPDRCIDCAGEAGDMSALACSMHCAPPGAILPTAFAGPLPSELAVGEPARWTAEARSPPPEPYPPRPIVTG